VSMPSGNIQDLLSLAMKGTPFMRGKIALNTKIDIPPLTGSVREKLLLDGQFQLSQARFLKSTVQDQIDTLSRRGRGQPGNTDISGVVSMMAGKFTLANEMVTFQSLSFAVPGSGVDLAGTYDLDRDTLDFHGSLRPRSRSARVPRHTPAAGEGPRDDDGMEAVGIEADRSVFLETGRGN